MINQKKKFRHVYYIILFLSFPFLLHFSIFVFLFSSGRRNVYLFFYGDHVFCHCVRKYCCEYRTISLVDIHQIVIDYFDGRSNDSFSLRFCFLILTRIIPSFSFFSFPFLLCCCCLFLRVLNSSWIMISHHLVIFVSADNNYRV